MAFRYKQQGFQGAQMAPITYALANLGNAFLSGPSQFEVDKMGMETDKLKVERDKLRREFDATGRLGDVVGGQTYTPEQAAALRREAILAGRTGADMGNIGRVFTFQAAGADQPTRDRAFMAAGGAADNTETGFDRTLKNRLDQAGISAGATIQAAHIAQAGQDRRTLGNYYIDGKPVVAPTAEAGKNRYTPVLPGSYYEKGEITQPGGAVERVFVLPGQPPAPGQPVARPIIDAQSPAGKVERDYRTGVIPPDRVDAARAAVDNPQGLRTRDAKVQDLVRTGVQADRAQALVDGWIEVKAEGGQWVEVDKRRGTIKPLRPDDPAVVAQVNGPGPAPSSDRTQRALSLVAGPVPSVARGVSDSPLGVVYNTVSGQGAIAPDTTSATSALQLLNTDLKRALQIGKAQKELDQIDKLLPGPGFFRSPAEEMLKFDNIRRGLMQANDLDARRLAGGTPLSQTVRSQIQKDMREREIAIEKMDMFVNRFGGDQTSRPQTGTEPPRAPTAPAAAPTPPLQGRTQLPQGVTPQQAIQEARDAIAAGKNRRMVEDRLKSMGIDPGVLR